MRFSYYGAIAVSSEARNVRRESVHIDQEHHELYLRLTTGDEAPFKTMKDLFMLAAAVGQARGQRTPITRQREIFRWPVFSLQEDVPVLRAIAIAETGSTQVLVDQDQVLTVAEEYANAGIEQIKREVVDQPGTSLDNLVGYLLANG